MNIAILSVGSRGDIQPYVALGVGLKAHGHNVKIITNENFRDFITGFGLNFHPLKGDMEAIVNSEEGKKLLESGKSVKFMKKFIDLFLSLFSDVFDEMVEGSKGSDLLIFSATCFIARYIAEYLNIKAIAALLQPYNRTSEVPSFIIPEKYSFIPGFNMLSHLVFEQAIWQPVRKVVNDNLVKKFNMRKVGFWGDRKSLEDKKFPAIYGFSKYVIPAPKDWGENHSVTGYWYLDTQKGYKPDKEFIDFLDDDKPIIYVGFGSMVNRNPEKTADTILRSVKNLDIKLIIMTGWGGLRHKNNSDNVFVINQVPHDWLFPKINAAVHHCGAGTTSAVLKAGIPHIPVPFFADQPFWGDKIYSLGLSSKPIYRRDMDSGNLREAVINVTTNHNMINRARIMGQKIRTENGVESAVTIIEKLFDRR